MIELTRLNGNPMIVNSDLIKYAESSPDTVLTLINGEKIMVLETCSDVVDRIVTYRARLLSEATRLQPGVADGGMQAALATAAAALRAVTAAQSAQASAEDPSADDEGARRRRRSEF